MEVNQIYAHYQNSRPELRHPDGGAAYFMENGLFGGMRDAMVHLAYLAITEEGSDIEGAMGDNMETYSRYVFDHAPWEFGDLRDSGHPVVKSNGETVYDRAPKVHRLSQAELAEKNRLRRIYDPERYTERGVAIHAPHEDTHEHKGVRVRDVLRGEPT